MAGASLESYCPVMFVDCVHVRIHCKRSVSNEVFCNIPVTEEGRCDVLGIIISLLEVRQDGAKFLMYRKKGVSR